MNVTYFSRIFDSSALVCGSYNPDALELTVVIKGKVKADGSVSTPRVVTYGEVPAETWVRLCTHESAGRYWSVQIVRNYPVVS